MPQTNEGILLVIGSLFLLLGLLGGGFEISAIKVPPVGKYTRGIALGIGVVVFGAGLYRLLLAPTVPGIPVLPTVVAVLPTAVIQNTPTPVPPTPPPTEPPPTATATPTALPTRPPPTDTVETPPSPAETKLPITGQIKDVQLRYDVTRFQKEGMLIQVSFAVTGLQGVRSRAVAYFYMRNGDPLKDKNKEFNTVDGDVSTGEDFTPAYESTQYDSYELFIPYDELELGPGKYELMLNVSLYDMRDTSHSLATSPNVDFDFNK